MKIIVADDEYFARVALLSILQELTPKQTEFLEAENGEDLILLVKKEAPDLIFLDIKMPKLGGLEAFSILKQQFPDILWVIVTGYADFTYARQALVLGAKDYLTKPVSPEEVRRVLEKIAAQIQDEKENRVRLFCSDMSLWLGFGQHSRRFDTCIFCATIWYGIEHGSIQGEKELAQQLHRHSILSQGNGLWHGPVTLTDGSLTLVSATVSEEGMAACLEKEHTAIREEIRQKGNGKWIDFQTGLCNNAQELTNRLQELLGERSCLILMKEGQSISWEQMKRKKSQHKALFAFCSAVEAMTVSFVEKDTLLLSRNAKTVVRILKEDSVLLSGAMQENLLAYLKKSVGETAAIVFGSAQEILRAAVWEKFAEVCEKQLLESKGSFAGKHIAESIEVYIREHYDSDISVGQIAQKFGITPNYLSTVFKSEMHVSFVQYLTEIRMAKAKELLAQRDLTISAIAEKVGYQNAAYFTRVFRENTGLQPTDFRKQLT